MERIERVCFVNRRGQTLAGLLHHPAGNGFHAAAILCHGMESNKESEKLIALSRRLAQNGMAALRFDFSCVGESSGRFEEITYGGEVEDLSAAFDFVRGRGAEKIGLFGSSMGGSVALLFAAQEKGVAAVVTLAAPVHPEKITERLLKPSEVEQWRETGLITYHGRQIRISFLDDLQKIQIPKAAREIACPVLILHGDADDTVPVEEAHELYAQLKGAKKISIFKGADHRLSDPEHLTTALEESIDWLTRHIR